MKVLIADDADVMQMILRDIIIKSGNEVVGTASNGNEAFKKYKELKPDLVTMDISMPGLNGLGALELIQKFDSNAKVVMCSAIGQKQAIIEAFKLGSIDYIEKPFKEESVLKLVKEIEEQLD